MRKVRPTRITLKALELHSSYAFLLLMPRICRISSTEYVLFPVASICPFMLPLLSSLSDRWNASSAIQCFFIIGGCMETINDAALFSCSVILCYAGIIVYKIHSFCCFLRCSKVKSIPEGLCRPTLAYAAPRHTHSPNGRATLIVCDGSRPRPLQRSDCDWTEMSLLARRHRRAGLPYLALRHG